MTTWASPTTPVFFLTGWSSYSLSSPAYDRNNDMIPSPPCAMAHLVRLWNRNLGVRARTGYLVSRLCIQCSKLFKCMKHTVLPMLLCTMINFQVIWLDYVIIIPVCRDIVILQKATWSNIHSLTPPMPPPPTNLLQCSHDEWVPLTAILKADHKQHVIADLYLITPATILTPPLLLRNGKEGSRKSKAQRSFNNGTPLRRLPSIEATSG